MRLQWENVYDDDDNDLWEAASPYHDEGNPFCFRIRKTNPETEPGEDSAYLLCSDLELMQTNYRNLRFPLLEEAMRFCERDASEIVKDANRPVVKDIRELKHVRVEKLIRLFELIEYTRQRGNTRALVKACQESGGILIVGTEGQAADLHRGDYIQTTTLTNRNPARGTSGPVLVDLSAIHIAILDSIEALREVESIYQKLHDIRQYLLTRVAPWVADKGYRMQGGAEEREAEEILNEIARHLDGVPVELWVTAENHGMRIHHFIRENQPGVPKNARYDAERGNA